MIDEDTLIELKSQNWEPIVESLTNFVTSLMSVAKIERYFKADDIVIESIERLYNGKRVWNKDKYPELDAMLRSIARSVLNGYVRSKSTKREHFNDSEASEADEASNIIIQDVEESYISEEETKNLMVKVKKSVEGDTEVELLLMCYEDGISSSDEICTALGVERKEYYNITKRLRRKILHLKEKSKS